MRNVPIALQSCLEGRYKSILEAVKSVSRKCFLAQSDDNDLFVHGGKQIYGFSDDNDLESKDGALGSYVSYGGRVFARAYLASFSQSLTRGDEVSWNRASRSSGRTFYLLTPSFLSLQNPVVGLMGANSLGLVLSIFLSGAVFYNHSRVGVIKGLRERPTKTWPTRTLLGSEKLRCF